MHSNKTAPSNLTYHTYFVLKERGSLSRRKRSYIYQLPKSSRCLVIIYFHKPSHKIWGCFLSNYCIWNYMLAYTNEIIARYYSYSWTRLGNDNWLNTLLVSESCVLSHVCAAGIFTAMGFYKVGCPDPRTISTSKCYSLLLPSPTTERGRKGFQEIFP